MLQIVITCFDIDLSKLSKVLIELFAVNNV